MPPSPTTDRTFAMSPSAALNGTSGLPARSGCCHGAHTLRKLGVLPASSFWIASRIRSSKRRLSPQTGSLESKSRNVKPKSDCPPGGEMSRADVAGRPSPARAERPRSAEAAGAVSRAHAHPASLLLWAALRTSSRGRLARCREKSSGRRLRRPGPLRHLAFGGAHTGAADRAPSASCTSGGRGTGRPLLRPAEGTRPSAGCGTSSRRPSARSDRRGAEARLRRPTR